MSLIATSTAADVTGILAAGVLATVGFVVIPYRRKTAKRELRHRLAKLREQLTGALTTQFEMEIDHSVRRVEDGISPYVQFVEGERKGLTEKHKELTTVEGRLSRFKADIEAA